MPPLTRQRTLDSILSWWSDSNPPGPTINLHAVAKPLIRFMYHQQVLDFIKGIRGAPLSEDTLQLCWDYLAYGTPWFRGSRLTYATGTVPSVTSRLPDKGVLIVNKDDHGSLFANHLGIWKHPEIIDTQ
jgi:hypothetical protein